MKITITESNGLLTVMVPTRHRLNKSFTDAAAALDYVKGLLPDKPPAAPEDTDPTEETASDGFFGKY